MLYSKGPTLPSLVYRIVHVVIFNIVRILSILSFFFTQLIKKIK